MLLLSGQTYPIKPPALLRNRLADASYVHHLRLPYEGWGRDGGLNRVPTPTCPGPGDCPTAPACPG